MKSLGADPTFSRVEAAWRNVASDLADAIADKDQKSIPLQTIVIDTGTDIIRGIVSGGLVALPGSGLIDTLISTSVEAYPVVSGLSRCSSWVRTADLRGLSRWMMSQ